MNGRSTSSAVVDSHRLGTNALFDGLQPVFVSCEQLAGCEWRPAYGISGDMGLSRNALSESDGRRIEVDKERTDRRSSSSSSLYSSMSLRQRLQTRMAPSARTALHR